MVICGASPLQDDMGTGKSPWIHAKAVEDREKNIKNAAKAMESEGKGLAG